MTHSFNRHYSRFIPSEEVGGVTPWQFGAVNESGLIPPPAVADSVEPETPLPPPGIDESEHLALLDQARSQAHAEGVEQGRAQASLEWQQRMDDYVADQGREAAERLDRLAQSVDSGLDGMQQHMAQELLALACDLARQVVRRELVIDPQAVLPVVREALGSLIGEGRPATVRLNAEDWAQLEKPLREEFATAKVFWVVDANVQPGDCLVESAGTVVDGSLDKRWQRAVAALGLATAWQQPAEPADVPVPTRKTPESAPLRTDLRAEDAPSGGSTQAEAAGEFGDGHVA